MRPRYIVTNHGGLFLGLDQEPWKVIAKTGERSWVVSMHDDIASARADAERLNALEEGLHRIAVAVAVWGAMEASYGRGWGEGYAHGLEDCGK